MQTRPEGKSTKSRARSLWQQLPRPCLREAREERLRLRVRTSTGSQRRSRTRSKPSLRPSRTRRTNAIPRINTPRWISVGSQQRYREGSSDGRLAKCHNLGCLHLGHRRGQPHRRTQKMPHRGRVDSRHRQRRHVGRRRGDGATPEQVSDWWSRLAEGERQRHVDRFTKPQAPNDESIREQARKFANLDGIEGWARDNVNRSLLEWDIEDTKRQRDALPGNKGPGEEYAAEGQARNHEPARLRERLEELEKLRGQLGAEEGKPPKQPLLYDPATGQRRNLQRAGRPHLRHAPPNRFCKGL